MPVRLTDEVFNLRIEVERLQVELRILTATLKKHGILDKIQLEDHQAALGKALASEGLQNPLPEWKRPKNE
jgi:hypothetical protein